MKREIAIISDVHGLYEPLLAVLEDIKKRGITEIYSLGDNIGDGPNPNEVVNLLDEYNVKSIMGNQEEYLLLGIEPFSSYLRGIKKDGVLWTNNKIGSHEKGLISLYPRYIELILGGEKIALCHFANDVRFDYTVNSTWSYQNSISGRKKGFSQFYYTNSDLQKANLEKNYKIYKSIMASNISNSDKENQIKYLKGYLSAYKDPLFGGKQVSFYDAIIEGHVHFRIFENNNQDKTKFYTLRALGMGQVCYNPNMEYQDPVNSASYVILSEKEKGFDYEEVFVPFDREKMISSIYESDNPCQNIKRFVGR